MKFELIQGPDLQEKFCTLLDRCFRVPEGLHFLDDFPVWKESFGFRSLRVGAFDGERIVSSAAARMARLKTARGELLVGLIGAVATDPDYRGQGIASQAVALVNDWAEEQGAAMIVLWGSEHEFYRRYGFELSGTQLRVLLADLELSLTPITGQLHSGWNLGISALLRNRPGGLILDKPDLIPAHRNVQWRSLEQDGVIAAYAGFGKGIDLQGIVHEWGGKPDALQALLAALRTEIPGLSLLGSEPLMSHFKLKTRPGAEKTEEFLCLSRIVDAQATRLKLSEEPLWLWGLDSA